MLKRFIDFDRLRVQAKMLGYVACLSLFASSASASVPSVVASSSAVYAHGTMSAPTKVVIDSKGNIFTADESNGALFGIAAGSTTPVKMLTGLGYNYGIAVDQYNDLVVSASYNGHVYFIPAASVTTALAGGYIGTPVDLTGAYNLGQLSGYYSSWADMAIDKNNVVYMSTSYCNCGTNTIFSVQTQGTSTTASTINVPGISNVLINNLPYYAVSLAVDTSNHLFFADGHNVYEILLTAATKTAVNIGSGFTTPDGVSVDAAGNLYVSDNGTGLLWEIPNENGTLNPSDQFVLTNPANINFGVAFDTLGNIYSGDQYNNGAIDKTTLGALNFGALPVGTASSNIYVTYAFNATVTPSTIALYQGTSASTEFKEVYSTCFNSLPLKAKQTCQVQLNFTPSSTGKRRGAVVLQGANNKPLGTAYLSGVGTGPAMTLDPGTQSSLTGLSAWKTPSAVALDGSSNIYVADSTANTVQVISAAGVATATVGSGLNKPGGIAVDGAGNVIIADTGNNQIVAVPNENGTLNTADQIVVLSSSTSVGGKALSSPLGLTVDAFGSIYVADSGNARVLRLSTAEGLGLISASTVGSGYVKPVALATDNSANLYVADATANQIDEINSASGAQSVVLGNLNAPTSIAIDASGSAYVVNSGTSSVLRIPNVNGALNSNTQLALGSLSLLKSPSGVAVNGSGNVAISDAGAPGVFTLVRTTGSLQFGAVDTSQSSISQTLTLTSAGTSSLALGASPFTPTGATTSFAVSSATNNGCTASSTLTIGTSCGYAAVFSPTATGPLTESLLFSTNAVNSGTLNALLTGTGTNLPASTTTLSVSPAAPYYGEVVSVIATVAGSASNPPTGTVTFYVDGIAQVPSALSTTAPYTATFTFPALSLTASTHSMGANYSGDANNASSHATPLTLIIAREPTSTVATVKQTVAQLPGTAFVFTATVSNVALGTPTGTVSLVAAGTTSPVLATGTLQPIQQGNTNVYLNQATISYVPPTTTGTYQYQLIYSGDVNFLTSSAGAISVMVHPSDYTVSLPSTSYTLIDGQSVVIPITITGISQYGGTVTVGAVNTTTNVDTAPCVGLPSYVTCSFNPGYVTPTGGDYVTSNPTGILYLTLKTSVPPPTTVGGSILWPGCIAGLLALMLAARQRRRLSRTRLMSLLLFIVMASITLAASGCGSSGGSAQYATPKGTTSFTVTFSGTPAAGYSNPQPPYIPNIVHTATISLTVQ